MEPSYDIVLQAENPNLIEATVADFKACWEEFMRHDALAMKYSAYRNQEFAHFHFFVMDSDKRVMALCKTIPTYWDGAEASLPQGYDDALEKAISQYQTNGKVHWNTLLGTSVNVFTPFRNLGLSSFCLRAMKQIAAMNSFEHVIIPVRPILKSQYPLISLERYIQWKNPDGRAFDPWLRAHLNIGGRMSKVENKSMIIRGTIADWEQWTSLRFLSTGSYVIKGALCPVEIDIEQNSGVYYDPNVWVIHTL